MQITAGLFLATFLPYAIALLFDNDFINNAIKNYNISFSSFVFGLIILSIGSVFFEFGCGMFDESSKKRNYSITEKKYYFEVILERLYTFTAVAEIVLLIIFRDEYNRNFWLIVYLIFFVTFSSAGLAGVILEAYIIMSSFLYKINTPPRKILKFIRTKGVVSFNDINKEFHTYRTNRWTQLGILGKYRRRNLIVGVSVGEKDRYYQSKSDYDDLLNEIKDCLNNSGAREHSEICEVIKGVPMRSNFISTACDALKKEGFLEIIDIGADPNDSKNRNRTVYSPHSRPMKSEEINID